MTSAPDPIPVARTLTVTEWISSWRGHSQIVVSPAKVIQRGAFLAVSRLLRSRHVRLMFWFLPTLLAGLYYFVIAADQYQSEAHFVVRSAARPAVSGGMAFLVQLGLARSQDDSFVVQEFMTSRDAIERLRARLNVDAIFHREGADFLARYPSLLYGPSDEQFYKYFQRMVSVTHIDKTGISKLSVRAFFAEDARSIAENLLSLSEDLINRLNKRLQTDAIASGRADLRTAQARLVDAQAAVTDFRNRELVVDPLQNAVALAELVARLSGELSTTQAQIAQMLAGAAGSPQLLALQRKAVAIEEQIVRERARISSDTGGLAERIASYERLSLEREFANRMMTAAEAELARAQAEATRQVLYLERVVEPHIADSSTEPKRLRTVLTVLGANMILLLVGWLIISGVREHAL